MKNSNYYNGVKRTMENIQLYNIILNEWRNADNPHITARRVCMTVNHLRKIRRDLKDTFKLNTGKIRKDGYVRSMLMDHRNFEQLVKDQNETN